MTKLKDLPEAEAIEIFKSWLNGWNADNPEAGIASPNPLDMQLEYSIPKTQQPPKTTQTTTVSVATMKLSGGRKEYYTRITCLGRIFDVRKYGQDFRNRAEYEAAELRHCATR